MSYITAYTGLIDPIQGRLPVYESIESLYDHVDAFVVADASKYDNVDLSKYDKVKKHVKMVYNPFDNPFGSLFTTALKLVDSDTALFLDIDEIFEFKKIELRDLVKQFPLDTGAAISFSLRNYYCSRNYIIDGCSSKGPHVFRNREDLYHDTLAGFWQQIHSLRRTNIQPDGCDGVRLCNGQGRSDVIPQYKPIPLDIVTIHHTSHLDPVGKYIRSIVQFNHTSTLDLPGYYPFDMRPTPEVATEITKLVEQEINEGRLYLYGLPIELKYEQNDLLDAFIKRAEILEFDPTVMDSYEILLTGEGTNTTCSNSN